MTELSPSDYFSIIKDKKNKITDEELSRIYDNCLILLNKYQITNQIKAMKKLIFHLETIEKEREIVKLVEEYIDNVANDTVKIIELENYEREIPDEIVEIWSKVKDKFDKAYVLFTDYTGKVERQVEKERREKDPILFGTFQDKSSRTVIDRFYYIGDWEDEHCNLTLDKMVNEVLKKKNKNIRFTIKTPEDIQELKKQLSSLTSDGDRFVMNNRETKKGLLSKVTAFLKRGSQ